MDNNQKSALIVIVVSVVILAIIGLTYAHNKETGVVHCSDGSTHPRTDASSFATDYTGYSAKIEAKLNNKGDLSANLGTEKLREMSDAIQQARLHLQALAEGYNACAVNSDQFSKAIKRYQQMEDIARQIESASNASDGDKNARLKRLTDEYISLSHSAN